jgi:predicted transcriptional regulator of viral defense system
MNTRNYIEDYLDFIRSKGRYSFTLDELKVKFSTSDKAILQSIFRLKSKKKIIPIRKGFYSILPPEYLAAGIIPTYLFIDDLMKSINKNYYVGLLSAAALHGASHQQTMETYVITEKPALRNIKNQKLKINFFVKNEWESSAIVKVKTDAGYINVSSPELTALDIIFYIDTLGINRSVTILRELKEVINPAILSKIAKNYSPMTILQRLGYLLDVELKDEKLSNALYKIIKVSNSTIIPLIPGDKKNGIINEKWRIMHNIKIDSDL